MPELIQIACPHCDASLKLKSRAPLGKKVECPKCAQPFVAKERRAAAAPVDDYEDYEPAPAPRPKKRPQPRDEFDDFDDLGEPDDFDAPPRRSSGGRKKKPVKKSKSSGGWVKWVLIGGGGVAGLAVLILGIWLAFRVFGSKKLDPAWLPEDANSISVTRYSNLMKSEIVKDSIDNATEKALDKMKDDWGFTVKDIESYTTASSKTESIRVLRTTVDLDPEKILKHAGDYEKTTYDGKDVYRYGRNMVYFPDKRTAISGSEESVKKAIDRGPKAKKRPELSFADTGYDIVKIRLIESRPNVTGHIMGIPIGKIVATCEGTSIGSSIKSKNQQKFTSVEDAKEYYEKVQEIQNKFKERLNDDRFLRNVPEKDREEMREFANSVSFSFSRSGEVITATVKATPPKSLRKKQLGFFGIGAGSQVISAARNPGRFFGIYAQIQNPFGNPNRFGNGNRGGVRPNFGRNRAGFNRGPRGSVKIYDVIVNNFRGNRDQAFEARAAIKAINGIDDSRTDIRGNRITLYSRPNQTVDNNAIIRALQAAGFGSVSVSQSRSE